MDHSPVRQLATGGGIARHGTLQKIRLKLGRAHPETLLMSTGKFPIQKWNILSKIKEINGLRGGVLEYAVQGIP